ncbi:MAG TPA: TetR/AcrR family transcriptional regulator [Anaerolineales bacterium]|nr:TetR/AcrR family transcriptional regulator [Anaerolineales bacterium]
MSIKSSTEREDPRITRTRKLIIEAFMESLREKGFQNLTVQDIAENAGIHRGTFYSHFPDKYALLDFSIQQNFQQEIEKRMLNDSTYSEKNLRELIVVVCEFISHAHRLRAHSEQQFDLLVEAQVKKQSQEIIQRWLEEVGSGIDPERAAIAASWGMYGLALQWNRDKRKNKMSADQFSDEIFLLIVPKSCLTNPD